MPRMLVEMVIDGVWTDITEDVRQDELTTMIRGRRNEGASVDPGRCVLKLNNRHGKYSLRNPASPYYGLLDRNAGLRVWLQGEDTYFWAPTSADSGRARVASSAALDVTEDLDVRIEVALDRLPTRSATGASQTNELIGRYNITGTPGNRMWRLLLSTWGRPRLAWSTNGDDVFELTCPQVVPYYSQQRFALRATLDVDNGGGGHTATFYIAPTLAGPWRQLGEAVTVAGVTSINQVGDASLEIGNINTLGFSPGQGRYYGAELRDGISGPLLAAPDFTVQTPGASSFTDTQGNTWLIELDGALTDYYRRSLSEITSWPVRWDDSGADVWVSLEANGVLRPMSQGKRPLASTLRRHVPTYPHLLAYWPMEDGADTTHATPAVAGTQPLTTKGISFAADASLVSSAPLPTVAEGATLRGPLPDLPQGATEWRIEMVYYLDQLPSGSPAQILAVDTAGGGISRIIGQLSTQGARLELYDAEGALAFFVDFADPDALADADQGWSRLAIVARPDGMGTTEYLMTWTPIGDAAVWFVFRDGMKWTEPTRINTTWGQPYAGLPIGHITYGTEADDNAYGGGIGQADSGWAGEDALSRVRRLADEENERLPVIAPGDPFDALNVGPQRIAASLQLLQDVAAADGGVLHELRDWFVLQYLPRTMLYNRPVALTLDQAAGILGAPLQPVLNDQRLHNEVTVTRRDGASATVQQTDGPLAVDVIGFKEDAVTLNLFADDQPEFVAAWLVHLGTVDEDRIPKVVLNLRNPRMAQHAQQILDMLVEQCRVVIKNPPAGIAPGDLDLIVEGYEERFDRYRWTITLTCSPASPWTVAQVVGEQQIPEDFEDPALALTFTDSGDAAWARTDTVAHAGTWSLKSGTITHGQTSAAVLQLPFGATRLAFWYKVSSEAGFDVLRVYAGGATVLEVSGEVDWTQTAIDVTDLDQVTFEYAKDASTSAGSDAAYIDDLLVTAAADPGTDQPNRVGTEDSELVNDVDDITTQLVLHTPQDDDDLPVWIASTGPGPIYPGDFPFDLEIGGEVMRATAIEPLAWDFFTRSVVDGWGTTTSGTAWNLTGGDPTDFDVDGNQGTIVLAATPTNLRFGEILENIADTELVTAITPDQLAAGGDFLPGLFARAAAGDFYWCTLALQADGVVGIEVRNGVTVVGARQVTPFTYTAGTKLWLRAKVVGHRVLGKVWPDGLREPGGWNIDRTITTGTLASGTVGIAVASTATNTNALFSLDDFRIVDPQQATVTRSINGIVKSHLAGASVRLARPATIPL